MSKATKKRFKSNTQKIKNIKSNRYGKNLSNRQIKTVGIDYSFKKIRQKENKHNKQVERHNLKKTFLFNYGIDTSKIKYKEIELIKMDDVRNNNLDISKYPFLEKYILIDYNKYLNFNEGYRLYVAYRDYTGENVLEDLINANKKYQPNQLLNRLRELVNMPLTGIQGVVGTSSGKAGTAIFKYGNNMALFDDYVRVSSVNRHFNRKRSKKSSYNVHSGKNRGYQRWVSSKSVTHTGCTLYNLLVIIVTLMENVVEIERHSLYQHFFNMVEECAMDDNCSKYWSDFIVKIPKVYFNYEG